MTHLDDIVDQVEELAPMPPIAMRVMEVAENDRFSANHLASTIASDQALTAKLLRLANSAYYGGSRQIGTVRDAVVLIGFGEVKSIAFATSLVDMAPAQAGLNGPFSIDLFWGHAVAAGVIAEILARETKLVSPDQAFTAGILHDIGRLVLNLYEPRFTQLVQDAISQGRQLEYLEQQEWGFTHADIGRRLAERWHFPATLADAIGSHHRADLVANRDQLAYVVAYADLICDEHGLWCGYDEDLAIPSLTGVGRDDQLHESVIRRLGGYEALATRVDSFLRSVSSERHIRRHASVVSALAADGDAA